MILRKWQSDIIHRYDEIRKTHKKFILKAPTGAGKTVLASEIIKKFYENKKILVLCHRIVLLEQLERELKINHKVRKLGISDDVKQFGLADIVLSTNLRSKYAIASLIPEADLIIIDEAHRVSPIGSAYQRVLDIFDEKGKKTSHIMGLTASPERRTGNQNDQLGLVFDAIIDCADIKTLIHDKVLVKPIYRPHFIHDLNLNNAEIKNGDFPISVLSNAIIKSSMIDYALCIYREERKNVKPLPISAWFCPDVAVANKTLEILKKAKIKSDVLTALTPTGERMRILSGHQIGNIEAVVSVGVLVEGWDNPNCNIIVHLRPTLSKVLWGQSVGRGLRCAKDKEKCVIIDVSSNWSTFGPVENLKWDLWSHRRSFIKFQNRFNWIAQQFDENETKSSFFICEGKNKEKERCSYIYKKDLYKDDQCPICASTACIDIHKEKLVDSNVSDLNLHGMFFDRIPRVFQELKPSVWNSLEKQAWNFKSIEELTFLIFCKSFYFINGDKTNSESEYWNLIIEAEVNVRKFLISKNISVTQQEEFSFSAIADGLLLGKKVRTVQAHYGIFMCGQKFEGHSTKELERKYQKALQIGERIVIMGCHNREKLPYFNAQLELSS
jgi:superfamily II DNA or RNA helicase